MFSEVVLKTTGLVVGKWFYLESRKEDSVDEVASSKVMPKTQDGVKKRGVVVSESSGANTWKNVSIRNPDLRLWMSCRCWENLTQMLTKEIHRMEIICGKKNKDINSKNLRMIYGKMMEEFESWFKIIFQGGKMLSPFKKLMILWVTPLQKSNLWL